MERGVALKAVNPKRWAKSRGGRNSCPSKLTHFTTDKTTQPFPIDRITISSYRNTLADMPKVYLLDYVAGNVRSLANAIEKVGYTIDWIKTPEDVEKADVSQFNSYICQFSLELLFSSTWLLYYCQDPKLITFIFCRNSSSQALAISATA